MNSVAEISLATKAPDQIAELCAELHNIAGKRCLTAVFQPIVDLHQACIVGFEGLIRGPAGSILHSPAELFAAARCCGMAAEIEYLSRRVVLETFSRLRLPGKVFLNVSPDVLLDPGFKTGETLKYIEQIGLRASQVIIEITENAPILDYPLLREATRHYRSMGFEIAIDDLGEGFSGLRLWSEIRPNYVKIDKHFIQNIHLDAVKLQFARSIQAIAEKSGARIIAEGIETGAELAAIRDLGIAYGQGYHIARPSAEPARQLADEICQALARTGSMREHILQHRATVEKLLKRIPSVSLDCSNEEVFAMFERDAALHSIPVTVNGRPVGLIGRYTMVDRFARPYRRELYGRKSCEMMMDPAPLVVEKSTSLHDLNDLILQSDPYHLSVGFIITENGQYAGMGNGHDLLRLVIQMQLHAARYANPLTLLPGNVPISEHIDGLLEEGVSFVACYCDLDHFKAFNDVYGYHKGDEIIQHAGRLMAELCGPDDFLGHIGGDDFIILFQNPQWEERCNTLLARIADTVPRFYAENDRLRGGIETEDRQGEKRFHPFISLSIGAVMVDNAHFRSHHEVSAAAAIAKKQAKNIPGNSLFIERRSHPA